ncbi:MAG TPA: sigma-70 family RNA polymerase sigma factor [Solirubrobacter sp.]|nr:sigma-70 family RNA polymerase sigma factor [Solirubrobacter sp.]
MEASAIHAPAAVSRFPLGGPLLRLRSDEQLLASFRAGNDEAFRILHDRYRQRLFAYVRQMLSAASRQDAEDVLQDVFVRAYGALRNDHRDMNVRAWLYRVAHNRCIDHLRRPVPPPAEVFEVSRKPLHDPVEEAQRRDDLRQLVHDVANLPEQQRSALLMREIDGMSYADLAAALDVTVPAVKSLLVRARIGLVEAAEARDADCAEIRADLMRSYDKGVKASGRARKHMRSCDGCREYRVALRGMRRSFAALAPVGFGPLALVAKLVGFGGSAGGAAAGGAAAGGSTAAVATGGAAAATACKVAAVVCTAAIATGGAVEVNHQIREHKPAPAPAKTKPKAKTVTPAVAPPVVLEPKGRPQPQVQTNAPVRAAAAPAETKKSAKRKQAAKKSAPAALAVTDTPAAAEEEAPAAVDPQLETGGARAPDATVAPTPAQTPAPETPVPPAAEQPQPETVSPTEVPPAPNQADATTAGGETAPPAG